MFNALSACITVVFSVVYAMLYTQVYRLTTKHASTVSTVLMVATCLMFPLIPIILLLCGVVMCGAVVLSLGALKPKALAAMLLPSTTTVDDDPDGGNMDQFAPLD